MITPKMVDWWQVNSGRGAVDAARGLAPKGLTPMHHQSITTPAVEWRSVVGFEGLYEVSSDGQIASIRFRNGTTQHARRLILKQTPAPAGYPMVTLSAENVRTQHAVHVEMARAFLGPRPSLRHVVAHWDGDPSNCSLENLRWATWEENEEDKRRHGRVPFGERNTAAKITAIDARSIRERHAAGDSLPILSRAFGLSTSTLTEIVRGLLWAEAGGPIRCTLERYGEDNGRSVLTEADVRAIRAARAAGTSSLVLAKAYGVSKRLILNIEHRRAWKHVP